MKLKKRLQGWLEIKQSIEPTFNKELQADFDKLKGDLNFWLQQMKKRSPTKKCTECKGEIDLWPFNTSVAYYIKGDKVKHVNCPTAKEIKELTRED